MHEGTIKDDNVCVCEREGHTLMIRPSSLSDCGVRRQQLALHGQVISTHNVFSLRLHSLLELTRVWTLASAF